MIAAPLDVLGVNYYNPTGVAAPGEAEPACRSRMPTSTAYPLTGFGWPVVPDGLRDLLAGLRMRYGAALPPIHITENGCSDDESIDGRPTGASPT